MTLCSNKTCGLLYMCTRPCEMVSQMMPELNGIGFSSSLRIYVPIMLRFCVNYKIECDIFCSRSRKILLDIEFQLAFDFFRP